jgi:hypothetical protein
LLISFPGEKDVLRFYLLVIARSGQTKSDKLYCNRTSIFEYAAGGEELNADKIFRCARCVRAGVVGNVRSAGLAK